MINSINEYKAHFLIILLYLSLIFGFSIGEDALGAAKSDYVAIFERIKLLSERTWYYFINYDQLNLRHSPIFQLYRTFFHITFNDDLYFKIINLHINICVIFIFYKSLKIVFNKVSRNNLIILSSIVFLLPSFRAYSIWPDSFMCGFVFFALSIYFYISFKSTVCVIKKKKFIFYNTVALVIASYISPNYGIFIIFYLYSFFKEFNFNNFFFSILLLNLLLSIPFLYYVFYLENYFFDFDGTIWVKNQTTLSINNLANQIIIVPTIFVVFFIPFLILKFKYFLNKLKNLLREFSIFYIFLLLSPIILSPFFRYDEIKLTLGGGGLFFNFFYHFGYNFFLLSIISSISILLISLFFYQSDSEYLDNKELNLFIFTLILTSPQLTIYIMYYEMILFIGIFLFFQKNIMSEIISNSRNIYFIMIYYALLLLLNIMKTQFLPILESI